MSANGHSASYYQERENRNVSCFLCPHHCLIKPGDSGLCGARKNIDGKLVSLNYGLISALALDPIEKKPLYHYHPGSMILSIGTVGCNMNCMFCQNYHLSRYYDDAGEFIQTQKLSPYQILKAALNSQSFGVAYTYSEPSIWFEYVRDVSQVILDYGLKNIWVTNGFIEKQPLKDIIPLTHAANIDLKAFTDKNYKKLRGRLQPVLDTITALKEGGVHIEITTLIVTDFNDNMNELESLVKWIASLDKNIPYHISRYFPQYHYDKLPTDVSFLKEVQKMANTYLNYVYVGNTNLSDNNTYCPNCGNLLIKRVGYYTDVIGIQQQGQKVQCSQCRTELAIVLN